MSRREFNARTRKQAWERANGFCEATIFLWTGGNLISRRCQAPLEFAEFHYDHIDPDFFGADDRAELDNCQLLCRQCHKAKTKHDIKNIAKTKRIINKRIKAKKSKRPMLGSRESDWKRTFNHGWVRR
jgi:5-methylcytosine-specific restriction endonuclease McrA